jgi:uncharacterized membrane protein
MPEDSTLTTPEARAGEVPRWSLAVVGLLAFIVIVSFGVRVATDAPFWVNGTSPEPEDFEARYVEHPWVTYGHLIPGLVYLLGGLLQASARFRRRHYTFHRRLGRLLVASASVSVVLALVIAWRFPWGGRPQTLATLVFGTWMSGCLVLAVRAIRRGDVVQHRRWMIRAFAMGIAVGTVRIWLGILIGSGAASFHGAFDPAFWLAFGMHALAAEWWLRVRPGPSA